ncbi:hemocyte protein-glutamine gamma-glutamyltransferase isoform X2 [Anoplophora glabripennis]|nr:hemocyte protein-glutamine gamma-glutamyltransferase isoform X2 [Anoplophora glabripennis]
MEPLSVTNTEFYCMENAKLHHTDEYDLVKANPPTPVLRRGATFAMAIQFNRPFNQDADIVRVRFEFGPKPNTIRGTRAVLPLRAKVRRFPEDPNLWGGILNSTNAQTNSVVLQVRIPPTAQIGIWSCSIQTNIAGEKHRGNRRDYKVPDDIYIIFNPWCPEDSVYMENEDEREEYILNETGKIWCGTFKNPTGKHWIFGQFDEISLPAAVFLLEKSGLATEGRGSPVLIARALSAIINSKDDDGLLEGKWDGEYGDGTSPHAWTGSTAILEQYLSTGGTPVKYGQCWVFSAVTVTICRALGLPCRSTTNYISAHDTNRSMTVDKYFDLFGNKIEDGPEGESDSCWNFHVWNDVWMTRPDLPPGYGGWQIIDATPQEESDKVMRCGPASVAAVKRGEVGYLYDTPFVFSEVNADVVHFKEDEESDWGFSRISVNKYHVGRKILTKKLGPTDDNGDSDLLDVTFIYKNKEGSEAERLAVYNAARGIPRAQEFYRLPNKDKEDVFFDLIDIDTVPFGEDFNVVVKLHNKANEERTIKAVLSASSIYYRGNTANDIKKSRPSSFKLKPGQEDTLSMTITPGEYLDKLVDHNFIKVYAIATVEETKQTWSEEDDFTLILPQMTLNVPGQCKVGEPCVVSFSFQNPLNIPLTECVYVVEGPGHQKPRTIKFRNVNPKEVVTETETFTAKKKGERKIVVNFTSRQIHNINASTKVQIV